MSVEVSAFFILLVWNLGITDAAWSKSLPPASWTSNGAWNLGKSNIARSRSLPSLPSISHAASDLGRSNVNKPSFRSLPPSTLFAGSNLGTTNVKKSKVGSHLPWTPYAGSNLGTTNVKKSKVRSHLPWTPYAGSNLGTSNVKKSKVGSPPSGSNLGTTYVKKSKVGSHPQWTAYAGSNLGTSNVKKSKVGSPPSGSNLGTSNVKKSKVGSPPSGSNLGTSTSKVGSPLSSTSSAASNLCTSNVKKSRVKKSLASTSSASASNSGVSDPKKARCQSPKASSSSAGCSLPIYEDKLIPLLLNFDGGSYKIAEREDLQVKLRVGGEIVIACADDNNKITLNKMETKDQMVIATCVSGEKLKINKADHEYRTIKCKNSIMGSVKTETDKCSNDRGVKKLIQFEIGTNPKYEIPLITVCYDEETAAPLYSQHELIGSTITDGSEYRGSTFTEGCIVGADPNIHAYAYDRRHQTTIVTKILSSQPLARTFLKLGATKGTIFDRGHLAPDADFYDHPTKSATYYYINIVPQWPSNNRGKWKAVECAVRKIAQKRKCILDVITGTHGVLSRKDAHENFQDIFLLEGGRCPVPKYIWKIVYHKQSQSGIALVTIHDPSITNNYASHHFCKNICAEHGWKMSDYVFCCNLNEFKTTIRGTDLDNWIVGTVLKFEL